MSEARRLHPVTRIRGELRPSVPLERAVNRFLEKPIEPGAMKLYTSSQVVVEQGDHRRRHALELARIEREFQARSIAQRALVLASPLSLQEGPGGSGRLFFNVQAKDRPILKYVGRRLGVIEGLEEPNEEPLLYVEFAKGALVQDRRRRREQMIGAREQISADLQASSAQYRMTATGLHVVTRDMMYPLKDTQPLPLAE